MTIQGSGKKPQACLPDINLEITDKDGDGKKEAVTIRLDQEQQHEGRISGTIFYSPSTGSYEGTQLEQQNQFSLSTHPENFSGSRVTNNAWTLSEAKYEENKILIKGTDSTGNPVECTFSPDEIYDNAIASSAAVLGALHAGSELAGVFGTSGLSRELIPGLHSEQQLDRGAEIMSNPALFGSGGMGSRGSGLGGGGTATGLEGLGTKGRGSGATGYGTGGGHFGSKGEGKIGPIGNQTQALDNAIQHALQEINNVLQGNVLTATSFGYQIDRDLKTHYRGFQTQEMQFHFSLTIDETGQAQQLKLQSVAGLYEILSREPLSGSVTAEGPYLANELQLSEEVLSKLLATFENITFQTTGHPYTVDIPFSLNSF